MQHEKIESKINELLKDNLLIPLNNPASDISDMLLEDGPSDALRELLVHDTLQEGEDPAILANLASALIQAVRDEAYTWEAYYDQAVEVIKQEEWDMVTGYEGDFV